VAPDGRSDAPEALDAHRSQEGINGLPRLCHCVAVARQRVVEGGDLRLDSLGGGLPQLGIDRSVERPAGLARWVGAMVKFHQVLVDAFVPSSGLVEQVHAEWLVLAPGQIGSHLVPEILPGDRFEVAERPLVRSSTT
jgi:hypothetical protein